MIKGIRIITENQAMVKHFRLEFRETFPLNDDTIHQQVKQAASENYPS